MMGTSHNQQCAICGTRINDLAGNPSEWGTWIPSVPQNAMEHYHGMCVRNLLTDQEAVIIASEALVENMGERLNDPEWLEAKNLLIALSKIKR